MLPVICVVGKSDAGKTALLQRLIPELKGRGYRVAVVKHTPHGFDLQPPGKDSWRLLEAGAELAIMSGPEGVTWLKGAPDDPPLEVLAAQLEGEYDLLLAEGYKDSQLPKVEVHRADQGPELMCSEAQLAALVSDAPPTKAVRTFRPEEAAALSDFLEDTYLKPSRQEEAVALIINGTLVPLNNFSRSIIGRGILGMVSALRGIGPIQRLTLRIRVPGS